MDVDDPSNLHIIEDEAREDEWRSDQQTMLIAVAGDL